MKSTVLRLLAVHAVLLVASLAGGAGLWGAAGSLAAGVGVLCFSIPVVVFSGLVVRASGQNSSEFWGRFMVAEVSKWGLSAVLLASAFAWAHLQPQALLAGFFLSVLAQVFFPIFVPKTRES